MGCGSSLQGQGQPKGQGRPGQPKGQGKRGGRASVIEAEAGLACLEINAFSEKKRRQSMKSMQSDASMAAVIPSEKASNSKSKSRAKQRAAVDVDESAEAAGHLPGCPQYPTDHAELEPQLRLENC
eukprot:symbB.v1.2.022658.t1/scaffold2027.1/size138498/6